MEYNPNVLDLDSRPLGQPRAPPRASHTVYISIYWMGTHIAYPMLSAINNTRVVLLVIVNSNCVLVPMIWIGSLPTVGTSGLWL